MNKLTIHEIRRGTVYYCSYPRTDTGPDGKIPPETLAEYDATMMTHGLSSLRNIEVVIAKEYIVPDNAYLDALNGKVDEQFLETTKPIGYINNGQYLIFDPKFLYIQFISNEGIQPPNN